MNVNFKVVTVVLAIIIAVLLTAVAFLTLGNNDPEPVVTSSSGATRQEAFEIFNEAWDENTPLWQENTCQNFRDYPLAVKAIIKDGYDGDPVMGEWFTEFMEETCQ